jgi:FKBP-type peptidyl-prolyl cis-trans isomerase 2
MKNPRAVPILASTVAIAVVLSGCLGGSTPVAKVALTLLSDADISASPGWTVGWAVEAFESTTENGSVALSAEAPPGWTSRLIDNPLTIQRKEGRNVTFLLVDIPADAANGTYNVKVRGTVGADSSEATGTVRVSRPTLNLIKNGSAVQMDYVGFLQTNEVFDTSMWGVVNSSGLEKTSDFRSSSAQRTQVDYRPLSFVEGSHQVIKGWETGIFGMSLGQGRALIIPPEEAYGRFVNQTMNTTQAVPIYNQTNVSRFQPQYGEAPVQDKQYIDPLHGWTVRVVSVDNATGAVVLQNLVDVNRTYAPYGVNATLSDLSSASGTFTMTYAPELGAQGKRGNDLGDIVEVTPSNFTVRWQTEHSQSLAPFTLYFLVFVRSVAG